MRLILLPLFFCIEVFKAGNYIRGIRYGVFFLAFSIAIVFASYAAGCFLNDVSGCGIADSVLWLNGHPFLKWFVLIVAMTGFIVAVFGDVISVNFSKNAIARLLRFKLLIVCTIGLAMFVIFTFQVFPEGLTLVFCENGNCGS